MTFKAGDKLKVVDFNGESGDVLLTYMHKNNNETFTFSIYDNLSLDIPYNYLVLQEFVGQCFRTSRFVLAAPPQVYDYFVMMMYSERIVKTHLASEDDAKIWITNNGLKDQEYAIMKAYVVSKVTKRVKNTEITFLE